jgi:hypothetical protein
VTSASGIAAAPVRTTPHCLSAFASGVGDIVAEEVPAGRHTSAATAGMRIRRTRERYRRI